MGELADFFKRQSIVLPQMQKREMLSLDKKFSDMAAEMEVLKTENLHPKAQVKPLEHDIERLKGQLEGMNQAMNQLDEISAEMFEIIANSDATPPSLAYFSHFRTSEARIEYHFDVLYDGRFISRCGTDLEDRPTFAATRLLHWAANISQRKD